MTDGPRAFVALGTCVGDCPFGLFAACVLVLFVLILLCGLRLFGWHRLRALGSTLKLFFVPLSGRFRAHSGLPVFIIASAMFLLVTTVAWVMSERAYHEYAHKLLDSGAAEFTNDFDLSVDNSLFFVGRAITDLHPTPESFVGCDLKELLSRYNVDEINVVDGRGRIVASTMPGDVIGQSHWEKTRADGGPCPRDFCVELLQKGKRAYAQTFRESATEKGVFRMYAATSFPKSAGYVQIGFDRRRLEKDFDYGLFRIAQSWTLGESGYFLLARNAGEIVSCGHPTYEEAQKRGDGMRLSETGFDESLIPEVEAGDPVTPPFEAVLFGEPCVCVSRRLGEYHRMVAALPVAEIHAGRNSTVRLIVILLLVVQGLGATFGARMLGLVGRLREFIDDDRRRRDEELRNARAIQTESLPWSFPDEPGYRIYARMDTAKEVGGDFYDFYTLPNGRQLFLIADTSGKGIPAAMFMMKAKAVIRAGLFEAPDFEAAVAEANDRLSEHNDANMFVTAWIGIFDPATREVEFVNCGHNPPVVKRVDGSVSWVRTRPCLALAVMSGARYRVEKLQLGRGDSLILYTDGVTEAMNASGEQYGERRLEADLAAASDRRLVELVRAKVAAFVAGAEQSDDITILSFDCPS